MKLLTIAILVTAGPSSQCIAGLGHYTRTGQSFQLSQSEHVQLVSEDVVITPMLGLNSTEDQAAIRCKFLLKNLSTKAVAIDVGFPFDADLPLQQSPNETDEVFSRHFIARTEHDTYHVRCVREESSAGCRGLFTWNMAFKPLEKRFLQVAYIVPTHTAVGTTAIRRSQTTGDDLSRYGKAWYAMLEPCLLERITYDTETAQSWKGSIEKVKFTVSTHGMSFWMSHRSEPFLAAVGPSPNDAELQRMSAMRVGLVYLQRSPDDWQHLPEEDRSTWESRGCRPSGPVSLCWFGTALPHRAALCRPFVYALLGPQPRKEDVVELGEIVAAFHGIVPTTESVKEFVGQQVWYHPVDNMSKSMLDDEERETVARLEAIAGEIDGR